MKKKRAISLSLKRELAFIVIIALTLCTALGFGMKAVGTAFLNSHFETDAYYAQADKQALLSLTSYVSENKVNSSDWYQLNKWVAQNETVYLTIYQDSVLTYDSNAAMTGDYSNIMVDESEYEKQTAFQVNFADGSADVILYADYGHKYYHAAYLLCIIIPCIIALLIILAAVRSKVKYITTLCNEIHIMEGGNLDYPITVKGKDELALLAGSVESLRLSFIQKLNKIMQLQNDSRELVTEMSHDMRTPMTPLLVYLGMLREGRFSSKEEHDNYVNKTYEKAVQLKNMSDNMFSYFLMDKENGPTCELLDMNYVFYDQLSAMADYLNTEGFKLDMDVKMENISVMVNMNLIARIFDNIVSNILKYADSKSNIIIKLYKENNKIILHFGNRINALADYSSSTGFGVKNIKKMMNQMDAECIITQKNENYNTFFLFKVAGTSASF